MSILVGSTGFVGGHLRSTREFNQVFHKSNINLIQDLTTNLLICAGLPAEKWKANQNPTSDWLNAVNLAQNLSTVQSEKAVLISTIDVYQPAINVYENNSIDLDGQEAYGRNRAWFEIFFKSNFKNSTIIRLPGVYGANLKKNFIFDLLQNRPEQIYKTHKKSSFQFFNITNLNYVIQTCFENDIQTLNVSSVPIFAEDIAKLFEINLKAVGTPKNYDMRTSHGSKFGKNGSYIYSREEILEDINKLRIGLIP